MQADDREIEGDTWELARFAFNESHEPGPVAVPELHSEDHVERFRLMVDLYMAGARVFNQLDRSVPLEDPTQLRRTTVPFLNERMAKTFMIEPVVTPVPIPDLMELGMSKYIVESKTKAFISHRDFTESHVIHHRLGIKLSFKTAKGWFAQGGCS